MNVGTRTAVLAAIAGGVISAVFYLSVATGSPGALVLAYLAPLPLFTVGLSVDMKPLLEAIGLAIVLVAGVAGGLAAAYYVAVYAVPVVLVVRQSLQVRRHPERPAAHPAGPAEWSPPGPVLVALCGLALLALAAAMAVTAGSGGLEAVIARLLRAALAGVGAGSGFDVGALVQAMVPVFAGAAAVSLIAMTVINACLAQGLLMRFGVNRRPPMRMAELALPGWAPLALAITGLVAVVAGGPVRFFAVNAAIILAVPFFFSGLAVVHAFAWSRRSRAALLVGFYGVLLVFAWLGLVVVGLGVFEQWAGLRLKFAGSGPDQEVK